MRRVLVAVLMLPFVIGTAIVASWAWHQRERRLQQQQQRLDRELWVARNKRPGWQPS